MLIKIVYEDGRHDMVKPFLLDKLLAEKLVREFRRDGQWVSVAQGELRQDKGVSYSGTERRQRLHS